MLFFFLFGFVFFPISTRFRCHVVFASVKDLGAFFFFLPALQQLMHYWICFFFFKSYKISPGLAFFQLHFYQKTSGSFFFSNGNWSIYIFHIFIFSCIFSCPSCDQVRGLSNSRSPFPEDTACGFIL